MLVVCNRVLTEFLKSLYWRKILLFIPIPVWEKYLVRPQRQVAEELMRNSEQLPKHMLTFIMYRVSPLTFLVHVQESGEREVSGGGGESTCACMST